MKEEKEKIWDKGQKQKMNTLIKGVKERKKERKKRTKIKQRK